MEIKKMNQEKVDCCLVESADGRYITPKMGGFSLCFANKRKDGTLFTAFKNGHAVSVRYQKKPYVRFPQPTLAEDNNSVCGHLYYKEVEKGIDLDYTVTSERVKENIVVKKKRTKYRFTFDLQTTKGLVASLDREKRTVTFVDTGTGEPIFTIPTPVMYDAAQASSDAVTYELKPGRDGYRFTVEADPTWINAEERALPVYIDPIMESTQYAIASKTVYSGTGGLNAGNTVLRYAGFDQNGREYRTYIRFADGFSDIDALKNLYTYINLSFSNTTYSGTASEKLFTMHRVTEPWTEEGLCDGCAMPAYDPTPMAECRCNSDLSFDILPTARRWFSGELPNYGMVILSAPQNGAQYNLVSFSSENDYTEDRDYYWYKPRLFYEVLAPNDATLKSKQPLTYDCGRAGVLSVDPATGYLRHTVTDVALEGELLPLTLTHTYIPPADASAADATYGKGWTINAVQKANVQWLWDIVQEVFRGTYTDSSGYIHELENTYQDNLHVIYDTNGNGVCGRVINQYNSALDYPDYPNCKFVLYDEKGNKIFFDEFYDGKMMVMEDNSGNVYAYDYNSNGLVNKITDGMGRYVRFTYNSSNQLSTVTDQNNYSITYSYSNGLLGRITYPDSQTVVFAYDTSGRLTSINNGQGITLSITYKNTSCRVASVKTYMSASTINASGITASSNTLKDSDTYVYYDDATAITARNGTVTTYRYDDKGQILLTYEKASSNTTEDVYSLNRYTDRFQRYTGSTHSYRTRYCSLQASGVPSTYGSGSSANLWSETFESVTTGALLPSGSGWSSTGLVSGTDGVSTEQKHKGSKSYKIDGSATATKKLSRTVSLSSSSLAYDGIAFSGWVKHSGAESSTITKCGITLQLKFSDGTTVSDTATFSPNNTAWQYTAACVKIPHGKTVSSATVTVEYSRTEGIAYFDELILRAVPCTTNIRDDIHAETTTPAGITRYIAYTQTNDDGIYVTKNWVGENENLLYTQITDQSGSTYLTTYAYDSKNRMTSKDDHNGMHTGYTYKDNNGLLEKEVISAGGVYYQNDSVYTQTDRLITQKTVSDQRGSNIKTTYTYDNFSGNCTREKSQNGDDTLYGYNTKNHYLTSVNAPNEGGAHSCAYRYQKSFLTEMDHNGFTYGFSYDGLGRTKGVTVAGSSIVSRSYTDSTSSSTVTTTYGNGAVITVTYDAQGNPTRRTYKAPGSTTTTTVATATYDAFNRPKTAVDNLAGISYNYRYNNKGHLSQILNGSTVLESFTYDAYGRLTKHVYNQTGKTYTYTYESNKPDAQVTTVSVSGGTAHKETLTRDNLRRVTGKALSVGGTTRLSEAYTYVNVGGYPEGTRTSDYIDTYAVTVGGTTDTYAYTYDNNGNITIIEKNGYVTERYTYDKMNQLVRADCFDAGYTYVYTYDVGGNLLTKKTYDAAIDTLGNVLHTDIATYPTGGWRDRMETFNTECCMYDACGNPTMYRCKNLAWGYGRRLLSYDGNTFTYDAAGIRIGKNNKTYTVSDTTILKETDGTNTTVYNYVGNNLVGFTYNGTDYIYKKNLQGDIVAIYTAAGVLVASYTYDPWGKVLAVKDANGTVNNSATFIGNINPFRYRGYYYDVETGLYYLQSRYYDPEAGRFINADAMKFLNTFGSLHGVNLFAYCNNDPINKYDSTGYFPWLILAAVLLFTPAGGTALQVATSVLGYIGMAAASLFDEDVKNDMNAIGWNPFNTDESVVLNSSKVSFYKGVPVFRTAAGSRSGSFGAIFLTKGSDVDTLRHERGHNWQLMMMGIANYGLMIGLPSWQEWSNRPYYKRPWEITADVLGGVTGRTHSQTDINRGYCYLGVSSLLGPSGYFFLLGEY